MLSLLAQSLQHLVLRCFCTLCSGASLAQGGGQVADLAGENASQPSWFPYVEIKTSPCALVKEEEPQDPKSFDLCCHISSSAD